MPLPGWIPPAFRRDVAETYGVDEADLTVEWDTRPILEPVR